jgi:dTDP-4-dehydrorhamnose reductase
MYIMLKYMCAFTSELAETLTVSISQGTTHIWKAQCTYHCIITKQCKLSWLEQAQRRLKHFNAESSQDDQCLRPLTLISETLP